MRIQSMRRHRQKYTAAYQRDKKHKNQSLNQNRSLNQNLRMNQSMRSRRLCPHARMISTNLTRHRCRTDADADYEDLTCGRKAVAIYDYEGEADDEISFNPDDVITNIEMIDEGWWKGQCHGRIGLFPAAYVQMM
ncbi:hypothetical protein F2P81_019066 [Scophthalmus maximus]|uniref:SH3 domain-containing protein n=1 Tax=Scophthalmus maximus TaxID=52904 RepID=A0A6A4SFL9_SCOMX|nr:hypothetical protein F2P81_019066 [Scophthalmus maximus]